MSVRNVLIVLNVLVVVAMGVIAVILLQRHRDEEKPPANLTPFFGDDDLETRRLERVLGWALIASALIAVSLPVYWLLEPTRQEEMTDYFEEGSVERGETLFANATMDAYDSAISLQCANCHGADGSGGSAPAVYTDPETGESQRVSWRAPALNTVLLRFSEDEVRDIITYGRPGTPMQPFGVAGGGPKNEQSINDLIAFLREIQLEPEEAKRQAAQALEEARAQAQAQLEQARADLQDAQDALAELQADPEATESEIEDAEQAVAEAEAALAWAREWAERRGDVSDGQLLFELFCARCHTKGWSIFDPTVPGLDAALGLAGGGGTTGFNLRDGSEVARFPDAGAHVTFVTEGSEDNAGYGDGGLGTGGMPGFGMMLEPEMIEQIVEYEREGLDENDPSVDPDPSTTGEVEE